GNRWASAAGKGLWLSILLRASIAPAEAPRITAWAAQTIASTVNEEFSLGATVKPPNDVYVGIRKVAGVLLELRAVPGEAHVSILGIGINVNQQLADFPEELHARAGSIAMALGDNVSRHEFAVAILRALDRTYSLAAANS
ncbi:MAG TPA: biotin--[acetyl-CoA-carboxylase] ligase, partial [Chthoniobacterales bacterium]